MLLQQRGAFHMWLSCYLPLGCHSLDSGSPRWLSGKESACSAGNAGDLGSSPGSGRSPNPGRPSKISKILQDSCMVTDPSILAWRIHGQRSLVDYSPWCCTESDMTEVTWHAHTHSSLYGSIFSQEYNFCCLFLLNLCKIPQMCLNH